MVVAVLMEEPMDTSTDRAVRATPEQVERLRAAMAVLDPDLAPRLAGPSVAIAHGHVPDFPRWEVLTIAERGSHPYFRSVALPRGDTEPVAIVLDGRTDTWNQLVAGTKVLDPGAARSTVERYLQFAAGDRRVTVVEATEDIPWSSPRTDASREVLAEGQAAVEGQVRPGEVVDADGDWRVGLTTVDQDRLLAHEVIIDRGGAVQRHETETLVTGLLVPIAG